MSLIRRGQSLLSSPFKEIGFPCSLPAGCKLEGCGRKLICILFCGASTDAKEQRKSGAPFTFTCSCVSKYQFRPPEFHLFWNGNVETRVEVSSHRQALRSCLSNKSKLQTIAPCVVALIEKNTDTRSICQPLHRGPVHFSCVLFKTEIQV